MKFRGRTNIAAVSDQLVGNLKQVAAEAEDLLRDIANQSAGRFNSARSQIEDGFGDAKNKLDQARNVVTERSRRAGEVTQQYVVENPWKSLGIVAAAGLIIGGLLVRRRH
jgi:ElaB/YqjD/DUF883 family membrane-anchored ribosome-binding protein